MLRIPAPLRALPPLMRFFFISISGIFLTVCYGLIFEVDSEESFLILLLLFFITSVMLLGIYGLGVVFYSQSKPNDKESD